VSTSVRPGKNAGRIPKERRLLLHKFFGFISFFFDCIRIVRKRTCTRSIRRNNVRNAVQDVTIDGKIDMHRNADVDVRIKRIVFFKEKKEVEDFPFADTKIFVRRRVPCIRFPNH
jgi:hypothetical protein